ncbi:MAG: hypothetical protein ACP5T3_02270 [Candidatus Micrarchaeia archaeon]
MRAQSSIEFLTTYGFMFIIIGIVVSVLVFITVSPLVYSPSQCSAFSGPYCQFVELYSNTSGHFSLATFVLTNSESVPLNISNITVIISGTSATGTCTPLYLLPGQSSVCVALFYRAPPLASYSQGFYLLRTKFCNAGVSGVANGACSMESANYSGSFAASASPSLVVPVTMLALQGPKNVQLAPYSAAPYLPNYEVVQSGLLSLNLSKKVLAYAFGTPDYIGNIYFGLKVVPFPQSVSSLSNARISCGYPYNSTYSIFATTLYLPSPVNLNFSVSVDDVMQIYYKAATSTSWASVIPSSGSWPSICCGNPKSYYSTIGPGLYNIEILWSNVCTPGVQVLKISNFSSSV